MKVAMVTHSFLPRFVGGREHFCLNVAETTLEAGIDCEIFCGDQIKKNFTDKYDGIVVHRVPNYTFKVGVYPYRFVHYHLWRELNEYDPDIIHVLDYRHFTTDVSVLFCKIKKKPIVLSIHGLGYLPNLWMKGILKVYDSTIGRYVLANVDKIIVYPKSKWIKRLGKKAVIIEHGIDCDLSFNLDVSNYFDLKEPFALCVGRLEPIKGFEPVVKAFKQLKDYKLVVIGGELTNSYGRYLKSLNENVVFTDSVSFALVKSALHYCKFYINSGVFAEGYGNALMEAMAFGKPILCNKANYLQGLINNKNAKIVDFRNQMKLKDSIKDFFEKDYSELGRRARETILPFDWNYIIKKFIQVYQEILGVMAS